MNTKDVLKITRTYGTNYNGREFWARVYLPHGALGVTASNVGQCVKDILLQDSLLLSVGLDQWRIDYNPHGIYFECRGLEGTEARQAELERAGFKRAKNAS